MAATPEYREHVCALLEGMGTVRTRKMLGEYLFCLNDKQVFPSAKTRSFPSPGRRWRSSSPRRNTARPIPGPSPT